GGRELGPGSRHAFVIGNWGGVQPESGGPPTPADYTRRQVVPEDLQIQQNVAKAMADRAEASAPDYVLNAGGNFHKMGISAHCDAFETPADTPQWADIYENMYVGPMADVQWLCVLGSVDYGGSTFTAGWDQQIAYTWERPPPWSGRWILPAQYYSSRVLYDDFTVEYFFVDSNRWSAYPKVVLGAPPRLEHMHSADPAPPHAAQGTTAGLANTFMEGVGVDDNTFFSLCSSVGDLSESLTLCDITESCQSVIVYQCMSFFACASTYTVSEIAAAGSGTGSCTWSKVGDSTTGTTLTLTTTSVTATTKTDIAFVEGPRVDDFAFFMYCDTSFGTLEQAEATCNAMAGCQILHSCGCTTTTWVACSGSPEDLMTIGGGTDACTMIDASTTTTHNSINIDNNHRYHNHFEHRKQDHRHFSEQRHSDEFNDALNEDGYNIYIEHPQRDQLHIGEQCHSNDHECDNDKRDDNNVDNNDRHNYEYHYDDQLVYDCHNYQFDLKHHRHNRNQYQDDGEHHHGTTSTSATSMSSISSTTGTTATTTTTTVSTTSEKSSATATTTTWTSSTSGTTATATKTTVSATSGTTSTSATSMSSISSTSGTTGTMTTTTVSATSVTTSTSATATTGTSSTSGTTSTKTTTTVSTTSLTTSTTSRTHTLPQLPTPPAGRPAQVSQV
ncbi:unnamed protein product, partial [Prorocentrum cordatum]